MGSYGRSSILMVLNIMDKGSYIMEIYFPLQDLRWAECNKNCENHIGNNLFDTEPSETSVYFLELGPI